MQHESSITISPARPRHGVLTLTGYGIRVAIERGHLTVSDGRGRDRREGRFPRTTRDLKRLVVIGHTGSISFDALRWLHDIGCTFVQIDGDGQVITASGPPGTDDARLRRAQAMAAFDDTGLMISRDLIARKLTGQADVLERFEYGDRPAHDVRCLRDDLSSAITVEQMRLVEAKAALAYWGAWAAVPVKFARKVVGRMPHHWQTFGARSSLLTGSPRVASNPPNAILNYLYAIAEAECRIALLAVGLDPGMGIVHADQRNRDSFACDVMEVIRPEIDRFVLDLIRSRHFGTGDFFETRQGACRLMPPITRLLAETAPRWTAALGPVVERVAQTLATGGRHPDATSSRRPLPTPLTQSNRSAGRADMRKHPPSDARARSVATLPAACHDCGLVLDDPVRMYCDDCLPEVRNEQAGTFAMAGLATLAIRRATGTDPAHGGDAGRARGRRNAAHHAAVTEWEYGEAEKPAQETFIRDILPILQSVSLRAMSEATGLTQGYCSFIRRGQKVPHRRHWAVLARIGKGISDNAAE